MAVDALPDLDGKRETGAADDRWLGSAVDR